MVRIEFAGITVSVCRTAPERQISIKIAHSEVEVPEAFTQLIRSMSKHRKRSSELVAGILLP
jgi:hypothetical protein